MHLGTTDPPARCQMTAPATPDSHLLCETGRQALVPRPRWKERSYFSPQAKKAAFLGYTLPKLREIVALSEGTAAAASEGATPPGDTAGGVTVETEKGGVFNTLATPTARREQALAGMVRTDVDEGVVAKKEPGNQHLTHRGLRPTLARIFGRASIGRRQQPSLVLDALAVALSHGYDGLQWYVSTTNLEMACLDLCVACRDLPTRHVVVERDTPQHAWRRHKHNIPHAFRKIRRRTSRIELHASRHIPALEVRSVTWEVPPACISEGSEAAHARRGVVASRLRRMVASWGRRWGFGRVRWPHSLRKITFGSSFNHSVAGITWPESLQELVFGFSFNRSVGDVEWPSSLERLTFGFHFNQAVHRVVWPASLRSLTFGALFNQSLSAVNWGDSAIECLTFGGRFNQSIGMVVWPAALRKLDLGGCNSGIWRATWPMSLTRLTFGYRFNQSVEGDARSALPRPSNSDPLSNHQLLRGHQLQHSPQLQQGHQLQQGDRLQRSHQLQQGHQGQHDHQLQHGHQLLRGVFPANLQYLTFGADFNQPIREVIWPPCLLRMTFGESFNQPVHEARWPLSLQQVAFGGKFNQPIGGSCWPESLRRLSLGGYDQCIHQVAWPALLQHLTSSSSSFSFGDNLFERPAQRVVVRTVRRDRRRVSGSSRLDEARRNRRRSRNSPVDEPDCVSSDKVVWPVSLVHLTLGDRFNKPIAGVVWPPFLCHLVLGAAFNRPVRGVVWPSSLKSLSFGNSFNRQISRVVWPASLESLTFGDNFNKPVKRVAWPVSLRVLTFGARFDQPVGLVAWPASMKRLTFGACFSRAIGNAAWPASLQHLTFGLLFDKPIHRVQWPAGLECLEFGALFDQPIHEVVWPPRLQRVTFAGRLTKNEGGHVEWPASLRQLTVCGVDRSIARQIA